tara:strand:+ start:7831 stop:8700 length:870 start_codon:yes stop_codon:yes gene_type:complete
MQIDKIKDKLIKLYQKSLYVDDVNVQGHPIRVIESCKSLIGIDRLLPNQKLVRFSDEYCKNFKLNDIEFDENQFEIPAVIGFLDLELALLDGNIEDSFKNAYYLTRVSDGKQILEFLLEFSIKYGTNTFLLILSIIRMEMFIGFKNILPSLFLSIKYIILDTNNRKKGSNKYVNEILSNNVINKADLNIFLNLYRLIDEDLVRIDKISPYIYESARLNCNFKKEKINVKVIDDQLAYGRMWISKHLTDLDYKKYSVNLLLDLDAFRACFKMSNSQEENKVLWSYLNENL